MNGKLIGFVLLLAMGLGGVWYFLQGESGGERRREQSSLAPQAAKPEKEGPVASGSTELELAPVETRAPGQDPAASVSTTERAVVEVAKENLNEADAVWLDVTLTLPPGLPLEDKPSLLAFARLEDTFTVDETWDGWQDMAGLQHLLDEDDVRWSRKALGGSTRVRVPFHRDGGIGRLLLESDYLYLDPISVEIVEPMKPVHLEPKLGGMISGRILFPPGFLAEQGQSEENTDENKVEVEFQGRIADSGFNGFRDMDSRDVDVAEDGTFLAKRLSPERTYFVKAETEGLATWTSMDIKVLPGENKALDINLEIGATISGTVTGDDGKPIEGVSISTRSMNMFFGGARSNTKTDELGKYEISGVSAGKVRLEAKLTGWVESEPQTLEVHSGQVLAGTDFVLERGLSIAGVVQWPDGQPAAAAEVKASVLRNAAWREEKSKTTALEDGSFVLHGLEEGTYEIRVEAPLTQEIAKRLDVPWTPSRTPAASAVSARLQAAELTDITDILGTRSRDKSSTWVAREQGVEVGTQGVQLLLKAPLMISGQVVDGQGEPVKAYKLSAKPEGSVRWSFQDTYRETVDDKSGMFQVAVPFEGGWTLTLEADEYVPKEASSDVEVPMTGPVTLVMNRAGKLSGTVVDPFGNLVVGAEVTATSTGEDSNPYMAGMDGNQTPTKTDEAGAFQLKAEGSRLTLKAKHEDWAVSEPMLLELTPSESNTGLVLQLRQGARITGEVFDAKGKPVVGQNVTAGGGVQNMFSGGGNTARTDTSGRFVLEHLEPGKITVTAMPSQEEMMKKMAESQDQTAIMNLFSDMVSETVEVADGAEVHVVLGQKAKDPVRLFGRVTEAGSGVAEAMVMAFNDGEGSLMEGMKAVRTDAGGRYEMEVDRPGSYVVNVQSDGFGGSAIQFFLDVPEVEEVEHDLTLPVGRIEGRVVGPDGKPVVGVVVDASREGGAMGMEQFDRATKMTKEDGSFRFDYRRPATYTLAVGANSFLGGASRYAAKLVSGIVVKEDQVVSGIEIALDLPGTLEGTVVDTSGTPVGGAAIHVRDASGRALARISEVISDPAGRFKYEGLPGGELTVTARTADECSTVSESVRIGIGQTTNVRIKVEPGAYLVVQVLDEREPVRARLRVLDEDGVEVSGLLSMAMMQELMTGGLSSKERRVGPLPPGKYSLEATTEDGKTAKKTVSMKSGEDRRLVKMRLKE